MLKNFVAHFDTENTDTYGGFDHMYDSCCLSTELVSAGVVKGNDLAWSDEYLGEA